MAKVDKQIVGRTKPWWLYAVIGAAGFGAGVMFDQTLRPEAPAPSTFATVPQQQSTPPVTQPSVATAPMPSDLPPAQHAVELGNRAYDQQNWADAIREYERAISLGSDTPDVRTDLGNAYRFSGNPQKALEEYRAAQQQNPNHEQSLFNQGALYAQSLGDPITAMAKWREFVERFPSSPRAADARRLLSEMEGQFGKVQGGK